MIINLIKNVKNLFLHSENVFIKRLLFFRLRLFEEMFYFFQIFAVILNSGHHIMPAISTEGKHRETQFDNTTKIN